MGIFAYCIHVFVNVSRADLVVHNARLLDSFATLRTVLFASMKFSLYCIYIWYIGHFYADFEAVHLVSWTILNFQNGCSSRNYLTVVVCGSHMLIICILSLSFKYECTNFAYFCSCCTEVFSTIASSCVPLTQVYISLFVEEPHKCWQRRIHTSFSLYLACFWFSYTFDGTEIENCLLYIYRLTGYLYITGFTLTSGNEIYYLIKQFTLGYLTSKMC